MPLVQVSKLNSGIALDLSKDSLSLDALRRVHMVAASHLMKANEAVPSSAHILVAQRIIAHYEELATIDQAMTLLHEIACLYEPSARSMQPSEALKLFSGAEANACLIAVGFKQAPSEKKAQQQATTGGHDASPPAPGAGI